MVEKMKELTADDLEEQYDEAMLDEFGKLTNDFQMKRGLDTDSMIRLLEAVVKLIREE